MLMMSQLDSIDFLTNNMLKRTRHPSGFYASLFSDALDRNFKLKYRPKAKRRQSRVFHSMEKCPYGIQSLTNANSLEFTKYCQAGTLISMLIAAACVLLSAEAELRVINVPRVI